MTRSAPHRPYRLTLAAALLLTLLTVMLSAYIRLAEAGVGCAPWPACYAVLGTDTDLQGIAVLTERGAKMRHRTARLAHRYVASVLGAVIVVLTLFAWRRRRSEPRRWRLTLALLGITVFLSLLGYSTPTRLVPAVTLGNLLGGMAMLALLCWLLRSGNTPLIATTRRRYRHWVAGLTLLLLQIASGAWVSANFAAAACQGAITCRGPWFTASSLAEALNPARTLVLDERGRVLMDDATNSIGMLHHLLALITVAYLFWFARQLIGDDYQSRRPVTTLLALLGLQLGLGMLGLVADQPLWVVSLHNTVAAFTIIIMIEIGCRIRGHLDREVT